MARCQRVDRTMTEKKIIAEYEVQQPD